MATIGDVRRIALSLPETSEGPLYGTPGFRVKTKAFARLRDEGTTLVVWVADEDEKEALIATHPEIFFTLPHYDGHPSVLVRLAAIATELRKVGATVEEFADGLTITPGPLHGAEIDTYNDHRMAMSMALIGLKVPGIVIRNPGCVAKTYPGFWQDLEQLRQ